MSDSGKTLTTDSAAAAPEGTTLLAARYDELVMMGEAPSPQSYAALHPNHPGLLKRLKDLERLRGTLDRLLGGEPPAAPPATPPQISGFRIVRCLAQGGMGRVWLAMQESPRRLCALKVISAALPLAAERFRREADLAGRLSHPGIAAVYAFGVASDQPYLVSEFVPGFSLRALLKVADVISPLEPGSWLAEAIRGLSEGAGGSARPSVRPPIDATLDIAEQVAAALAHAHESLVVHRDIKPANIMITHDGRAKLIDFGIAVPVGDLDERFTHAGAFVGSVAYAAPEQLRGEPENVGPWTDTYSLGATLYEMLTQEPPFGSASYGERLEMALRLPPRGPRAHNPEVPVALDALVMRALSPSPRNRFQDGEQMMLALRRIRASRGTALSALASPLLRLPRITRGWVLGLGVTALLLLTTLLWLDERGEHARDRSAERERARATAEAVLRAAVAAAQPALGECVTYRPVPFKNPVVVVRVVMSGGVVTEVEVLGGSMHLTSSVRRCLTGAFAALRVPGIGLDAPLELTRQFEIQLAEP